MMRWWKRGARGGLQKEWGNSVINAVLLKVRPPNCISPGTTSLLSKSTRRKPPAGSKRHTGTQA